MAEGEADSTSDAHVNTVSEDGGGSQEEVSYFQKLYERISPRMRGLILLNMLTLLYGTNRFSLVLLVSVVESLSLLSY